MTVASRWCQSHVEKRTLEKKHNFQVYGRLEPNFANQSAERAPGQSRQPNGLYAPPDRFLHVDLVLAVRPFE